MKAVLRTRCGCRREILMPDEDNPERWIHIALMPNLSYHHKSLKDETIMPPVRLRRFEWTRDDKDGNPVYDEVLEGEND